jgi:sugar lactone lactonase YvrE
MYPLRKHIGTILLPERRTNMTFGNADGKTLYITDRKSFGTNPTQGPGRLVETVPLAHPWSRA